MFKPNAKFDADSLLFLLSHFECHSCTVHMYTQWHLPPPLTSTVKSSLFMHVHSRPLFLAAMLHWCCVNRSFYINSGWTFFGQTSYTWFGMKWVGDPERGALAPLGLLWPWTHHNVTEPPHPWSRGVLHLEVRRWIGLMGVQENWGTDWCLLCCHLCLECFVFLWCGGENQLKYYILAKPSWIFLAVAVVVLKAFCTHNIIIFITHLKSLLMNLSSLLKCELC